MQTCQSIPKFGSNDYIAFRNRILISNHIQEICEIHTVVVWNKELYWKIKWKKELRICLFYTGEHIKSHLPKSSVPYDLSEAWPEDDQKLLLM